MKAEKSGQRSRIDHRGRIIRRYRKNTIIDPYTADHCFRIREGLAEAFSPLPAERVLFYRREDDLLMPSRLLDGFPPTFLYRIREDAVLELIGKEELREPDLRCLLMRSIIRDRNDIIWCIGSDYFNDAPGRVACWCLRYSPLLPLSIEDLVRGTALSAGAVKKSMKALGLSSPVSLNQIQGREEELRARTVNFNRD